MLLYLSEFQGWISTRFRPRVVHQHVSWRSLRSKRSLMNEELFSPSGSAQIGANTKINRWRRGRDEQENACQQTPRSSHHPRLCRFLLSPQCSRDETLLVQPLLHRALAIQAGVEVAVRRFSFWSVNFLPLSKTYLLDIEWLSWFFTCRCPPQELHQAVKSRDILAVLQAFAEGVELSTPLPGHVSV